MFSCLCIHAKINIAYILVHIKKKLFNIYIYVYICTFETNPKVGDHTQVLLSTCVVFGTQKAGRHPGVYIDLHLCITKCVLFCVPSFLITI